MCIKIFLEETKKERKKDHTDYFDKDWHVQLVGSSQTIKLRDPLYCAANLAFLMNLTPLRIKK